MISLKTSKQRTLRKYVNGVSITWIMILLCYYVGFIKFNQDMRFNIIIRSILNHKNQSEISAASGVVLDSSPKKEFNENYIKAKSLLELFK